MNVSYANIKYKLNENPTNYEYKYDYQNNNDYKYMNPKIILQNDYQQNSEFSKKYEDETSPWYRQLYENREVKNVNNCNFFVIIEDNYQNAPNEPEEPRFPIKRKSSQKVREILKYLIYIK